MTALAGGRRPEAVLFREEQIDEILSVVLQSKPRMPIVVGEHGVGKSALMRGIAARLVDRLPVCRVVSVDLGVAFAGKPFEAEREHLLAELLQEGREQGAVLVVEGIELAYTEIPHGRYLLDGTALAGTRIVGVGGRGFVQSWATDPRFRIWHLRPLSEAETGLVVDAAWPRIAAHHSLAPETAALPEVVVCAAPLGGSFPGKAVELLDVAAARAALLGAEQLDVVHVHLAAASRENAVR